MYLLKLSNYKNAAGVLALAASLPLVLTGCQDEEFGYTAEYIKYEKAYKDFFGEMPKDKNWDLTSNQNYYDPDAQPMTRANGITPDGTLTLGEEYVVKDNYWQVPNDLFDWMSKALLEGKDNRYLGSNFVLQLPDNDFVIVPIFQGKSSIMSELEVKINGYNIQTVWSRSQNIQVKDHKIQKNADSEGWMDLGYYEGYSGYDQETMRTEGNATIGSDNKKHLENLPKHPSYTDESDAVRAKPIYFRSKERIGVQDKGFMYLSLHNIEKAWANWDNYNTRWDEACTWTTRGHRLTSVNPNGHMLALNIPSYIKLDASNLPDICEYNDLKDPSKGKQAPSQTMLIACEDANGIESDHDVNDVAFLIIGYPNVPTVVPTKQVIAKRYMCEDLGGTYDYDFNDIVVDCKQTQEFEIVSTPSEIESYEESVAGNITITDMHKKGCPVQTAKISRLCGTIPLQVRIGDFMFPKIKDPVGHNDSYAKPGDGKYWTRRDLIEQKYMNYCDGNHEAGCSCGNHSSYASGGHQVNHQDITRATTYPEDHEITEGWNPNEEQIIPCHTWDPKTNNIVIYADWGYQKQMYNHDDVPNTWTTQKQNNPFEEGSQDFVDFAEGRKFAVTFPEEGAYPFIIAVNPDVPWMEEEKHIPDSWVKGDFSDRNLCDQIGNSFYMEGYPAADGEGYIWSGEVTGIAYSTGITIWPNTAEMAAIEEAKAHDYLLLHVYATSPNGEVGRIGLYSANDWKPIADTDPNGYILQPYSSRVHDTARGINKSSDECVTLYLTTAQYNDIKDNGLVVASRTNGVVIKKITTARPCVYGTDGATTTVDPGFTIKLAQPTNGTIRSDYAERVPELKEDDDANNNAELARASIPFAEAKFITGSTVTLTAVGAPGYKLSHWTNDGSNIGRTNPLTVTSNANLVAVFEQASNPGIAFDAAGGNQKEINITLIKTGGAYNLPVYSHNLSAESLIGTNGENNAVVTLSSSVNSTSHILTITPVDEGETSFIIYQPDGDYNGQGYGVSEELKVNVKVISQIPDVSSQASLGNWAMYQWHGTDANAYIVDKVDGVVNYNTDVTTDGSHQIFSGNDWGNCYRYVDLPHAKWLIAEVNSGNIEFKFNVQLGDDGDVIQGQSVTIDANSKDYCEIIYNGSTTGKKYYIVNVEALRNKYGYVHLNSVRALWQQTANVSWIKADNDYSELRGAWDTLKGKISSAQTDLSTSCIYQWSDASAAATTDGKQNTTRYQWKGESNHATAAGEVIYGDTWTLYTDYVDLSKATVIVATVPKSGNEIEFAFNKQQGTGDNASYNGDATSVRPANEMRKYCAVVTDGSNYKYVIDAVGLKNQLGVNYLHLNYIRKPYNGDNTETYLISLKTDVYDAPLSGDAAAINTLKQITGQELEPNKTADGWITPQINQGVTTVYGVASNIERTTLYDDLDSRVSYIKVVVYNGGVPRFFINHDLGSGFIITQTDNTKYMYQETNAYGYPVYYIDVDKIRSDKGNVHLNAIKSSAYNEEIVVSDLKLGIKK